MDYEFKSRKAGFVNVEIYLKKKKTSRERESGRKFGKPSKPQNYSNPLCKASHLTKLVIWLTPMTQKRTSLLNRKEKEKRRGNCIKNLIRL